MHDKGQQTRVRDGSGILFIGRGGQWGAYATTRASTRLARTGVFNIFTFGLPALPNKKI